MWSSLYIVEVNALLAVDMVDTFSQYVTCLLSLCVVPFSNNNNKIFNFNVVEPTSF